MRHIDATLDADDADTRQLSITSDKGQQNLRLRSRH